MSKRIIALIMTAIMGLSLLAGCKSSVVGGIDPVKNYIAEVSGEKIPSDTYQYYMANSLIQYAANVIQYYGSYSDDTLSQILAQTLEDGTTIADSIKSSLVDQVKYEYAVNLLFKEYNLALDVSDEKTIQDAIDNSIKQYGSEENFKDLLSVFMIDIDSYKNIMSNSLKYQKLILHLYGTDGVIEKVSEQAVKDYYAANNSLVKHILINTQEENLDLATGETTEEAIAKKKALANDIYKKVQAGEDFDALLKQYGEDPGMTSNPKGYVVNESSNYVEEFKDAALEMKIGEYRLVESDYGYHIMYRDDVFNAGEFDDLTARIAFKGADFDKIVQEKIDSLKFTFNDKTMEKLNPATFKMKSLIDKYQEISEKLNSASTAE